MEQSAIYNTNDELSKMVAAGLIEPLDMSKVGNQQTPNWNQHVLNMEYMRRFFRLDVGALERAIGFREGQIREVVEAITPTEITSVPEVPAVPGMSFAEAMAAQKAAQDAIKASEKASAAAQVHEAINEVGVAWNKLSQLINKLV